MEEKLLDLLTKYHHYKFMTNKTIWLSYYPKSMNLGDFIEWLKSREK